MVIKRQIDGKDIEIELSPEELRGAYDEQEHLYDTQDVLNKLEEISDEDFTEYGLTREFVESSAGEIAYEKRRNISKYDMEWESATEEAISDFLLRNSEDDENGDDE